MSLLSLDKPRLCLSFSHYLISTLHLQSYIHITIIISLSPNNRICRSRQSSFLSCVPRITEHQPPPPPFQPHVSVNNASIMHSLKAKALYQQWSSIDFCYSRKRANKTIWHLICSCQLSLFFLILSLAFLHLHLHLLCPSIPPLHSTSLGPLDPPSCSALHLAAVPEM